MSIENTRAQITAQVWQAIAQSGVDVSAIPQDKQEKLVSKITDLMMLTLDHLLDEIQPDLETNKEQAAQPADQYEEQILWRGRPFLSLVENYTITNERIKVVQGFLGKDIENFELIRIQDLDLDRNLAERIFKLGDLTIHGADPSDPKIVLRNIADPEKVYELLRKAWLEARRKHGLQFREYM
jgi:hypothetical protein